MDKQEKYLKEVSHQLQRAGFHVWPEHEGLLPVEWSGGPLCHVRGDGALLYQKEILSNSQLDEALDRVAGIAQTTMSYMRQMAQAPRLRADGLSGDYRLLTEFNGVVLAGHEREGTYGVEFVTWERIQNGTGLWQGHYHDNNYAAARQEFAVRSGLVGEDRLLSDEQMAEVYRCIRNTLENDETLTVERENLLQEVCGKMQRCIPGVEKLAIQEPEHGMEQSF